MIDILTLEGGMVKLTVECYTIPELKKVCEKYKDPIPALCFLRYTTHPLSAYLNLDEEIRDEEVYKDYPGEYKPTDLEISIAKDKLNKLYLDTTEKYFKSVKGAVEKLANYLDEVIISDSKDFGNIAHVQKAIDNAGKTIESFKKLEAKRNEDKKKARGNKYQSWDLED